MLCHFCGSSMVLDDKDFHSKGNFDNYWGCDSCGSSCIEEVRNFRSACLYWHSEADDSVTDFVVNNRILPDKFIFGGNVK